MCSKVTRIIVAGLMVAVASYGCEKKSPKNTSQRTPSRVNSTEIIRDGNLPEVSKIADGIIDDVGQLKAVSSQGNVTPVFVFEEYHTSRVGQLQTAVMLLRLHDNYGLRIIGLEGAIQSERPLDLSWFFKAGDNMKDEYREDVAVRMLSEGEINSAEFMSMVFKDVEVRGLELKDQYAVKPDFESSPGVIYLLGIAEKMLGRADIIKVNDLINRKKEEEAIEYMLTADPWVRKHYEAFQDPVTSLKSYIQRLNEIKGKALELSVQIPRKVEEDLEESIHFFEVASQRSITMTRHLVQLRDSASTSPVAMIVGAAHSEEVLNVLREQEVPYTLISPIALNPEYACLSSEEFQRKNDRKWTRIGQGTLGRLLNAQRKPPPVIQTATAKSYASALLAAKILGEGLRDGKRIPDDVRTQLAGLPELRIDWNSVLCEEYDVIFSMRLKRTDGSEVVVWARAGTGNTEGKAKKLEEKLMQSIADLGGHNDIPPRDPPPNSTATGSKQGPGDGMRGSMLISRIGTRTVVIFAERKDAVVNVGRISG